MESLTQPVLIVDSHFGIYTPFYLAKYILSKSDEIAQKLFDKISTKDLELLIEGPENESYWETYEDILNNSNIDLNGTEYYLDCNEDLWLCPTGYDFETF